MPFGNGTRVGADTVNVLTSLSSVRLGKKLKPTTLLTGDNSEWIEGSPTFLPSTSKPQTMNIQMNTSEMTMYNYTVRFGLNYLGMSDNEAHEYGIEKVLKDRKVSEQMKDQTWVDLSTGKKFKANF